MACLERSADRDIFERYLREALADAVDNISLYGYALMSNHVHLLAVGVREGAVPAVMQRVGTRYARYYNASRGRTGAVFGGRYWASLIETERYFFAALRYIELNPVRAGLVIHPADYSWSSYRHSAGLGCHDWLRFHGEYLNLGASSEARADRWAAFVNEGIAPAELDLIRRQFKRRQPFGSPAFLDRFSGK